MDDKPRNGSRPTSRTSRTSRPARPQSGRTRRDPRAAARVRSARRGQRPPLRIPLADGRRRVRVVVLALAVIMSFCGARLLQLQGFDSQANAAEAARRMTQTMKLPATRGQITDRYGTILAETAPAVLVFCDPQLINPPPGTKGPNGKEMPNHVDEVADLLMKHIGGVRDDYVKALTKPAPSRYSVLARKVPAATYQRLAADLNDRDIYGVARESDPIRTYPEKETAAALIGFVGADNKGLGGVELSMNKEMAGTDGKEIFEASKGYRIPLGSNVVTPPADGTSYQLTIDTELQQVAERSLAAQVKQANARSGTAITMNIKTGEVLAMANVPTFDPNTPATARSEDMFNRSITQAFEPGSVQKVLTMAALIDSGHATPDTKLVVPPSIKSGGGVVKDVWYHGYANATARGVLMYSSNIGTIMLTRQMPTAQYREYLKNFGLGQPTGIELPGEGTGFLPPADMNDAVRDQISFGQGLSVTALQNAAALSGVLNGGVYNQPTILKSATDANGNAVPLPPREKRRVVSEATSKDVASMMETVVGPDGFAKEFKMAEYRIGGKTGTSENFDAKLGKYSGYTASFVGMAPADDPQILTYVVVDDPKNGHTGGAIAGWPQYEIMRTALPRYGVPLQTTPPPARTLKGYDW
ncbi:peptidoglycan D,D-transpeptidase FtsI family protein [Mariniluteicoccus endophyticus]